jgi:SAM-dependent methyltransferase
MRTRTAVLISVGASLAATGAVIVLRPALADARRSLATSSSPGAGLYELLAGALLGGYYDDVASDCATVLGADGVRNPRILEVGPGPGHVAERLLGMLRGAHWTGLDIDPAMLRASEARLRRLAFADRAAFVEADVAALPFEDEAFDLVVSSFSAHHWPDPGAGFAEIRRVLRPGCRAIVYDLPVAWGRLETGSAGTDGAHAVFDDPAVSTVRGVGRWAIVRRYELAKPAAGPI